MYVRAEFIENKFVKRLVQHIFYIIFLSLFIPSLWYFEVLIVLPALIKNIYLIYMHVLFALFFLVNIVGNLVFGAMENSSISGRVLTNANQTDWSFCSVCETLRPPRSWHCKVCGICILKRDHHCAFITSCVGHYNQRYFFNLSFYVFVSTACSSIYNLFFLAQTLHWDSGSLILKFIFPMVYLIIDFGMEAITIVFVVITLIISILSGMLVKFHLENILRGRVTPEIKKCKDKNELHKHTYDNGWRNNLVAVFGTKWYLTWILPFIKSPLPGNGIDWDHSNKFK